MVRSVLGSSVLVRVLTCVVVIGIGAAAADAQPLPEIPVGQDAYRMWEHWPRQRIGARAYMRSTYDRHGGNRKADSANFLYQLDDDFNVTLDVEGRGVLYFARYNHWHGSPWHYEVDGQNHIVDEKSPNNPRASQRSEDGHFVPRKIFPEPLCWTHVQTHGANLIWRPIPFEDRFRMGYSHTRYGTGYYIYHLYNDGANLSQPIESWNAEQPPDPEVLDLLSRAGQDIAPSADEPGVWKRGGRVTVPGEGSVSVARLEQGPAVVRALKLSVPRQRAVDFGNCRIRVTWDGRDHPSIDAPVNLFFGTGTLYNRDDQEYLVKGLPINVRFHQDRVQLACYFPMPFFQSAKVELVGSGGEPIDDVTWQLRGHPLKEPANHVGYFHATYADHPSPPLGFDMVWLDTDQAEGGGPWSGQVVGTTYQFTDRAFLPTLEGDPRFFFDGSMTPQAQGTGSEEWGGGGDYWGGRTMSLPLAGHPVGAPSADEAKNDLDLIHSAYRFLLADLFPFGRRAVIRFEHGGRNNTTEHYRTVVYWYGLPAPSLVATDELNVGDPASETAHDYQSPQASEPYELTSRYEWGVAEPPAARMPRRADPDSFADFEFEADADKKYYIWLRGKSDAEDVHSDAVWMQFDDQIGTPDAQDTVQHPKGFGNWRDIAEPGQWAWSSALPRQPARAVTFEEAGTHRLRIQTRQAPHTIDQIWLSATQKTRPRSAEPVAKPPRGGAAGIDQIVLDASDVVQRAGGMTARDDDSASTGQALHVSAPQSLDSEPVPEMTKSGRTTTGTSDFTLQLRPDNHGVLLRRTLDYVYPNQRARVSVAPVDESGQVGEFEPAGTWYLAGSNTYYHSYPADELDPPQPQVMTSPRRFRDDEFLVPKRLTAGRKRIRVRVEFTPVEQPLLPGHELPQLAWSEMSYTSYCWIEPPFDQQSEESSPAEQ